MSDKPEFAKYVKDSRTVCKYGPECYQKNPMHHQKYKHPPDKNKQQVGHVNKKIKIEEKNKETKEVVTSRVSDFDEDNAGETSNTLSSEKLKQKYNSELKKNEGINKEVITSNDVSDSDEDSTEEGSNKTSNKNGNKVGDSEPNKIEKTDKKHENITKENHKMPTVTSPFKVQINNDVSESEDSGDETNMDKSEKTKVLENKDLLEKTQEKRSSDKLDYKQFIKEKFLVDMPEDFYQFWNYCKKLKPNNPIEALRDIGLKLVGPFDVVAGRFDNVSKSNEEYLVHWRYYHDPPELQTVLKGDDRTGYHIGYFRDSPDALPIFLANNSVKKDGVLYQMGPNIFAAVNMYLEDLKKTGDPFKKMHIGRIQSSIKKEADSLKLDLSQKTNAIVSREKKVVSRTFNKIGLVVPYDRKTQVGYRELALNNKDLNILLTKLKNALPEQKPKYLAELQPVFTFASIAADECDFGTGIELGWNIISHGVESLNSTARRFLVTNYELLNREAFATIAEAHMTNRKKGCDLSII